MTIFDFVRLTRHNLVWILGCIVLGVIAAFGYTQTLPVLYAANSTGYVVAGGSSSVSEGFSSNSLAQQKAQSYVPLVTSRAVAQNIKDTLGLPEDIGGIGGSISVEVIPGTVLMRFTAVSESPERAQQIADAAVQATSDEAARLEQLSSPGTPSAVQIVAVESAVVPSEPFSPNTLRNLGFGALAGLAGRAK